MRARRGRPRRTAGPAPTWAAATAPTASSWAAALAASLLLLLLLLALAACDPGADGARVGADASDAAAGVADTAGAGADGAAPGVVPDTGLVAQGAWVRAAIAPAAGPSGDATGESAAGGGPAPPVNTAAYLTLRNATATADALVSVRSPIAGTAELHQATMADGVMRMRAVDSVAVPAGGGAVLEPGGYHVMLIGLREAVSAGDSVRLTLRFRSGRVLELTAPVRRSPPE